MAFPKTSMPQLMLFLFLISISFSLAQTASKPKALVLPVSKDATTLQYLTKFKMGTPPTKRSFVVDLGGRHLWMDCDDGSYLSSTLKHSFCGSAPCSVAKAQCFGQCQPGRRRPGCDKEHCYILADNTIPALGSGFDIGLISLDKIALQSTDGSKFGPTVTVSDFIFGCLGARERLSNLAKGADGMIGLGRQPITLPTQLSSGGSFRKKFAICLPSTPKLNGVMFFGDSPYAFYPSYNTSKTIDVSTRFHYTKLYVRTEFSGSSIVTRGPPSPEYFVNVTSILVNRKPIFINPTFLEFHRNGKGGAKIATVEPYTKLETTIYKSLVKAFDKEIAVLSGSKVSPVAPFTDCYKIDHIGMTPLGIGVPDLAFEFENNKNEQWEMYGFNSMVEVSRDVACLAFLDAGDDPIVTTPIVIGAHQLQDNLLQFDLASNRLAFTRTLLLAAAECSNFKF
ncbi:probable aspartic proteinase GIP2 [Jatropha curcas]|uniref:probable aspartic proteinase GIP2 n=1 Tax=Jatropha curcas TaxID=180498 RepID=UPI0005FA9645|nr:probable aspartic proteinase GIP2 [Jatropha curcas]